MASMRRKITTPIVPFTLLLISLGGCGGGSQDNNRATPAGDAANYIPMADGNRWIYQEPGYRLAGVTGPVATELHQLINTTLADGTPALQRRKDFLYTPLYVTSRVIKTADAVRLVFDATDGPPFSGLGSLRQLRLPMVSGESYTAYAFENLNSGNDSDGDGLNELFSNRTEVNIGAPESVTVPAGTFSNSLKVTSHDFPHGTYSKDGSTWSATTESTSWYVPNIGLVKSITTTVTGGISSSNSLELIGYKVAGFSTDTTSPTVISTVPASTASVSAGSPISVEFSEDMDPSTLSTSTFTLKDSTLTPVSGTTVYSTRNLTFTPDSALVTGSYTATLSSAKDALGNSMVAPYSWSFTIH